MTKIIAPITTGITVGQAGRIADRFITLCRTAGLPYPTQIIQDVLEQEGDELAQEQFESLRKRVERRSKMIVRRVTVNRARTPQQMLEATGRVQYVDPEVVGTMPGQTETTDEVEMYFFNEGRFLTIDEQETVLATYGLVPDYYAQFQVNIDDETFADEHPNGMQWRDSKNRACCVAFRRYDGKRDVYCYRLDGDWRGHWWFAGRKSSK